jgi:hypothetical protein
MIKRYVLLNWKGCGRERWWLYFKYYSCWKDPGKPEGTSVRTTGLGAEI